MILFHAPAIVSSHTWLSHDFIVMVRVTVCPNNLVPYGTLPLQNGYI